MKLHTKGAWDQTVARENDVFLMNNICSTPRSAYILERINDVRLWLKVSRLSDIADCAGTQIMDWALYDPLVNSPLKWPKRRKPLEENLKL